MDSQEIFIKMRHSEDLEEEEWILVRSLVKKWFLSEGKEVGFVTDKGNEKIPSMTFIISRTENAYQSCFESFLQHQISNIEEELEVYKKEKYDLIDNLKEGLDIDDSQKWIPLNYKTFKKYLDPLTKKSYISRETNKSWEILTIKDEGSLLLSRDTCNHSFHQMLPPRRRVSSILWFVRSFRFLNDTELTLSDGSSIVTIDLTDE